MLRHILAFLGLATIAFVVGGCQASVGTAGVISVPKDATPRCAGICTDIGLNLASVVVMANHVGCVCEPSPSNAAPDRKAASAAGGMAAILLAEEEQRQQQQQLLLTQPH
jgi:hypothetical protein